MTTHAEIRDQKNKALMPILNLIKKMIEEYPHDQIQLNGFYEMFPIMKEIWSKQEHFIKDIKALIKKETLFTVKSIQKSGTFVYKSVIPSSKKSNTHTSDVEVKVIRRPTQRPSGQKLFEIRA